jgi:hypothetical protein
MGNGGPAGFGDDMGAGHTRFVTDVFDLVNDVIGVFFKGIIDAGKIARFGAVIIDAQATADIEVFQVDPQLL